MTGETLLKKGMNAIGALDLRPATLLPTFWRVFTTPMIVIGFALIFGGSLFWLVVLSKWNLSLAYPAVEYQLYRQPVHGGALPERAGDAAAGRWACW